MSLATVHSRARAGLAAPAVTVEVHLGSGLPGLSMVGLPETAVKESKDRVRAAIVNSGFKFPARRITINLAPADLPKEGGRFDLAIALGILAASQQLPKETLASYEFLGELSLGGTIRPTLGVLPAALQARAAGHRLVVAADNGAEAALADGLKAYTTSSLLETCAGLKGQKALTVCQAEPLAWEEAGPDLSEVRGQQQAKRALEIAAAGGHSMLMQGPPGAGKSMLAARLPGILPPMTEDEALEAAAVASISHIGFDPAHWGRRPFRSPHHTSSGVALVGGGSHPRPGEITLAHHGVLFLDELPEYDRRVLEVLREPLENGRINISRAARQTEYPARFQLIGAMNPCPCGYLGEAGGRCHCTAEQVHRYRARLSGPLLDRIDMHLSLARVEHRLLLDAPAQPPEESASVRTRVSAARERALARAGKPNAALSSGDLERHCRIDRQARALLEQAMARLNLSARAYHRVLKLARTIADMGSGDEIRQEHIAEALSYRLLDRPGANA
jgi:magnesium chelatase family protein